jgi:chromosome partitioning protein
MRTIAFVSDKGGVGKTLTAVNITAVFAKRYKVLLLDADPISSAYWWVSRVEQKFDYAVEIDPNQLRKIPQVKGFDFVFLDTPSHPRATLINAVFEVADVVILPSNVAPVDITMAMRTADSVPKDKPYKILLSRVDPRSYGEAVGMLKLFGQTRIPHFKTIIRSYKIHQTAQLLGLPVTGISGSYSPEAQHDIRLLAKEVSLWLKSVFPLFWMKLSQKR